MDHWIDWNPFHFDFHICACISWALNQYRRHKHTYKKKGPNYSYSKIETARNEKDIEKGLCFPLMFHKGLHLCEWLWITTGYLWTLAFLHRRSQQMFRHWFIEVDGVCVFNNMCWAHHCQYSFSFSMLNGYILVNDILRNQAVQCVYLAFEHQNYKSD